MRFPYYRTIVNGIFFDIMYAKKRSSIGQETGLTKKLKRRKGDESPHEASIGQLQNAACRATASATESDEQCTIRLDRNAPLTALSNPTPYCVISFT